MTPDLLIVRNQTARQETDVKTNPNDEIYFILSIPGLTRILENVISSQYSVPLLVHICRFHLTFTRPMCLCVLSMFEIWSGIYFWLMLICLLCSSCDAVVCIQVLLFWLGGVQYLGVNIFLRPRNPNFFRHF